MHNLTFLCFRDFIITIKFIVCVLFSIETIYLKCFAVSLKAYCKQIMLFTYSPVKKKYTAFQLIFGI